MVNLHYHMGSSLNPTTINFEFLGVWLFRSLDPITHTSFLFDPHLVFLWLISKDHLDYLCFDHVSSKFFIVRHYKFIENRFRNPTNSGSPHNLSDWSNPKDDDISAPSQGYSSNPIHIFGPCLPEDNSVENIIQNAPNSDPSGAPTVLLVFPLATLLHKFIPDKIEGHLSSNHFWKKFQHIKCNLGQNRKLIIDNLPD